MPPRDFRFDIGEAEISTAAKISLWVASKLFGDIEGPEDLAFHGYSETVYRFKSRYFLGIDPPGDILLLEEGLFEEGAEKILETTFLHEKGHQESGYLCLLGAVAQPVLLSPPGLLIGVALAAGLGISAVQGHALMQLEIFQNPAKKLSVVLSLYLAGAIFSYYAELKAEFFTIDLVGPELYQEALEDARERFEGSSILVSVLTYLSHPPRDVVMWLYSRFRE